VRSEGQFWCPSCFCRRDFILAGYAQETEALPDLECYVCGYTYTTVTEERGRTLPPIHHHPITKEMRDAAKREMRVQFMQELETNGHPLELVTAGRLKRAT
jgi:hypothetical protein